MKHAGEVERLLEEVKKAGDSKIAIIGFPWDENSSFLRGAAQAPTAIRAASDKNRNVAKRIIWVTLCVGARG